MQRRSSPTTSERYRNDLLVLLSGEPSTLPQAEARALILAYDKDAEIASPEERVVIAKTKTDPDRIAGRIAYSRRVGLLMPDGRLDSERRELMRRSAYRVRIFRTQPGVSDSNEIISRLVEEIGSKIELDNPEYEVSVVRGARNYFALTKPGVMRQSWVSRRPRSRAFFHPAAIFPKLARALVNLTRVREGERLLDPYVGTGSLLIEGAIVGADCIGIDLAPRMVRGALANREKYAQSWLGLIRADSPMLPVRDVDGIVTDVPYGRASSTAGSKTIVHIERLMENAASVLRPGRRAVVMHPRHYALTPRGNLEAEEEHHLFVHKKLTRTITVLRRT